MGAGVTSEKKHASSMALYKHPAPPLPQKHPSRVPRDNFVEFSQLATLASVWGFAKDLEEAMTHGELSSFLESMGISTDDVWTAGPGGSDQVV